MPKRCLTIVLATLTLGLVWATPNPGSAGERDFETGSDKVVTMTHLLLMRQFPELAKADFYPATVYVQPKNGYWAVVGRALQGMYKGRPHMTEYVAGIQQTCVDVEDENCWYLAKLFLDGELKLEASAPL